MPQHDRHRIAQHAFNHFEIGMAQPDRLDAHQHVIGLEFLRFNRLDDERSFRRMQHRRLVLKPHLQCPRSVRPRLLPLDCNQRRVDIRRIHLPVVAKIGNDGCHEGLDQCFRLRGVVKMIS